MPVNLQESNSKILYKNFLGGLGWGLGATLGVALVFVLLGYLSRVLGGLPIIGSLIAGIIESTQEALRNRRFP
jgi:hypothetical protein